MALLSLTHPGWVAIGLVLIGIGVWLIRWANRNNMAGQIAGAAAEAAANALRKGAHHEMPSAIKAKYDDVASQPTYAGKAKKVAGYGFRNAMSQLFGVIGFIATVIGLMLVVLGLFYA
jgi:protein-S-isoprenylcysteine O-methyltransferase Ste14